MSTPPEEMEKLGAWESLATFYNKSSYGKSVFEGAVLPTWVTYEGTSAQFMSKSGGNLGPYASDYARNWYIAEYAKENHGALGADAKPLKYFDNNGDGFIDLIWIVYSHPTGSTEDWWAYVTYTGNSSNKTKPTVKTLGFASIDWMDKAFGGYDPHTFIHETGHTYGLDDYYDYISKENEEKLLALLEDFYQVSHFHDFFMAHQSVYTECENAMQHVIDQIDFRWYDTSFGPRKGGTFHIYPNILIGPANYAVHQKENSGAEIINAVMGCCLQDGNGEISYDTYSTLPIIIHECNHSFCNPLNEEFWPQLQTTMDAFYAANAQHYKDEAYGGAQYVLNETFVEACVMRYLKTHPFDFSENIERWQQVLKISDEQLANATDRIALLNDTYINLLTKIDDEDKRFYMIRDVIKVLEEREQNQEAYPTMHDFMPRYIETINAYK